MTLPHGSHGNQNRSCFLRLSGFPLFVPFPISQLSLTLISLVTQESHCHFGGRRLAVYSESPIPTFVNLAHKNLFSPFF